MSQPNPQSEIAEQYAEEIAKALAKQKEEILGKLPKEREYKPYLDISWEEIKSSNQALTEIKKIIKES